MYKLTYGNYNGEEKLYRIYIKNGITYVDTLKVIDPLSKQAWYQSYIVGLAMDASIESNGIWTKDEINKKYNFTTEEYPYIFWVDNNNVLYCQIWNDTDTKVQLATDVVKISTLRGWKNVFFWNHDQGLIVAYIKSDGKVYYRNYCKQPPDQPAIWETERQISNLPNPAQDISLFRTNDYRVGFMANCNGITYWTLTERDWAGMSIPIERVTASPATVETLFQQIFYINTYEPNESINVTSSIITVDLRYALTDNQFVNIYNQEASGDWSKELIFTTQHRLYNYDVRDFEIVDSYNRTYYANTITEIEDRKYKLEFLDTNNFNNVDDVGTLNFKGLYTMNGEGLLYQTFSKVFYPINLVPTFIPIPEVGAIWNE